MFTLNSGQSIILQQAIDWFKNSSDQVFEIDGLAGTGKSVLIFEILKALNLNENQYMPMAYTGQASLVMRTKGFLNARTIHSSLYEVVETKSKEIDERYATPRKRKVFRKRLQISPEVCLFFIDEAYMVPDFMEKDILSFGVKTIVCGDAHQLPPVGGKPAFLTGKRPIHHLTQLMRQEESNPIVYIANRAMKGLPIHTGNYGKVLVIDDDELIPEMFGYADVVICGLNRTRDILNGYIRNLYGYSGPFPHPGERLICRKNNWDETIDGIPLANGLSGICVNSPDNSLYNGYTFKLCFKPYLTESVFENLDVSYKYFNADTETKKQMRELNNTPIWQRIKEGEYFEYAYAQTTHLSQGSEYNNGIYIEEFMRSQIQNQLNYTGITRFKNSLIYVRKRNNKYINIPYSNHK